MVGQSCLMSACQSFSSPKWLIITIHSGELTKSLIMLVKWRCHVKLKNLDASIDVDHLSKVILGEMGGYQQGCNLINFLLWTLIAWDDAIKEGKSTKIVILMGLVNADFWGAKSSRKRDAWNMYIFIWKDVIPETNVFNGDAMQRVSNKWSWNLADRVSHYWLLSPNNAHLSPWTNW